MKEKEKIITSKSQLIINEKIKYLYDCIDDTETEFIQKIYRDIIKELQKQINPNKNLGLYAPDCILCGDGRCICD